MFKRVLVTAASLLALSQTVAAAEIDYHVTSSADSGPNTLRQAILDSNALGSDYPHIYIDLPYNEPILLQSSLPTFTSSIVMIEGTQSSRARIDGVGSSQILHFGSAAQLVSVKHLDLERGGGGSSGSCMYLGAHTGYFGIDDTVFRYCISSSGGGALFANGDTTVKNATFYRNSVVGTGIVEGGAIKLYGSGTSLDVQYSRFVGNTVETSTTSNYQPAEGGAIYVEQGDLSVSDTGFSLNEATSLNMPGNTDGGAVVVKSGSLEMRRNAVHENTAADGGAVYFSTTAPDSNRLTLVNNTLVGNVASQGWGGAIHDTGNVIARNNSFFANAASISGDNIHGSSYPGSPDPVFVSAYNNLFVAGVGNGDSCTGMATATDSGYNILPQIACGLGFGSGTQIRTGLHLIGYDVEDYLLKPLRFTVDSPALDSGNPVAPNDDDPTACPLLDGQSQSRSADGNADTNARCDIGAYEWQHEAPLFMDDFEARLRP
ncbi:MAG: hypothetical protein WBW92_14180 [Rhodanobacteraceae bacterium]